MKTNLENFISDNRDALDGYEPGHKVWESIENHLPGNRKKPAGVLLKPWIRWSSVAAALIIIFSVAYYSGQFIPGKDDSPTEVVNESGVPAEYEEEMYHFTKLIELKHEQLQKIGKDQPELYRQFAGDISRLDSNYQVLRKELPGHPNKEELIHTMIRNLQWQVELLNEQLTIIQKIKQFKTKKNEKIPASV